MVLIPGCLIEDLLCGTLDPFAPMPPIDYPAAEGHYWERVDHLLRHPRWQRCLRLIRHGARERYREGVGVLILGVLSVPGFPPWWTPDASRGRVDKRSDLDLPELQVSSLTELMVAATADSSADYRMIDLVAVGLYEAGLQLEIETGSLLAARLREVRQLIRGFSPGDSQVPIGGLYGITLQGHDLANVLPTELADRRLFLVKYTHGELLYWRRISPSEEEPYVRFRVSIDTRQVGGRTASDGHSFTAWAKALALWICHDLSWHVSLPSQGLRYLFEIMLTDAALDQTAVAFHFWLDDIFSEFASELAREQPFLEQVTSLLPFFLRSRLGSGGELVGDHSATASRQPLRQNRLPELEPYSSHDPDIPGSVIPETQPIFAFDLRILAGEADMATAQRWLQDPFRCATLRLTEETCALCSESSLTPTLVPYDVHRIYDLRLQFLELIVEQMLTTLTNW